jgi:hypothetical protein
VYGDDARVIPYDYPLSALERIGPLPPQPWRPSWGDPRQYAQPVETPDLLKAYAGQKRWEATNAGIIYEGIPVETDRVSVALLAELLQHIRTASIPDTEIISFTQNAVAYPLQASHVEPLLTTIYTRNQQARDLEKSCLDDLNSETPTILTYDEIDLRFAAMFEPTVWAAQKQARAQQALAAEQSMEKA